MNDLTRAVFDCNTFLQALAAPEGPAGRCVQLALDGAIALFISPIVIAELRDVAARPKVAAKLRLTPDRTEAFVAAIELVATSLDTVPARFTYARDPDDAHYVDLAVAAQAELIVSRDKDLLSLMDEGSEDGKGFRRQFPGLRVLNPVQFLQEYDAATRANDGI